MIFGEYLLKKGIITKSDVEKARALQTKRCSKIGKKAQETGLLGEYDIAKITRKQDELRKKFCEAAEELELLSHDQSMKLLDDQKKDYIFFGEALILSHILPEDVVKRELKLFCKEREEFWRDFFKKH